MLPPECPFRVHPCSSVVQSSPLAPTPHYSQIVEPEELEKQAIRDPDDLKLLGLIAPANADVIGDKDLLVIKKFKKARIITPRDFWETNKK